MQSTNTTDTLSKRRSEIAARVFLVALVVAAIITGAGGLTPGEITLLPCPFHKVTGVPCAGCGMTRACVSLASGDVSGAWHFHPLSFLLVGGVLAFALFPEPIRTGMRRLSTRQRIAGYLLLTALVFATWIIRLNNGWT